MKLSKSMSMFAAVTVVAMSVTACSSGSKPAETTKPAETAAAGDATAATAASPAAGGTAELKPEAGAKLKIWDSKDERAFTDEMIKEFTAKYNVPVELEELAPPNVVTRLQTDGPTGLAADVMIFPHDHVGRAVAGELLLPNDVFGDVTKKENTESAIQGISYENVLFGYPRAAETYALYYNKDLVKEAPKSFDDVIAFSKTFNKDGKYGIMWETGNFYFNYPFIASSGGYLFGKNGTDKNDIGINNDGAVASMKVYASLKQVLPVKSADITADIKRGKFTGGEVAMDINGPWELAGYKKALGDKLGVADIPTIAGKPAVSFSGIKAWYVSSFTKYPNAAKLFARFASTKDAQLKLNKLVGSVPTNKDAQNDPQIKNDPYVSGFVGQFNHSVPMPSIPEMNNVWAPAGAALTEVWDNGKDPKTVLDNAVTQIKDLNNGAKK
ncbi:sugar ABC transporter substrate-binding protein [Paenibacillus sedimenti]|uniref:Maltodextrin-binding protein n=1 Tax=Paenibacillus sedimenti TaxID=2770274 RepID=A0A926KMZ6_9BACL|nr:maltose ABC transporter substrate-binding protein [Paenibacillus sedimenti]MBD0380088.1 maltose ABC transporter substrate-binding protein [Paenibacillus sedimenti]